MIEQDQFYMDDAIYKELSSEYDVNIYAILDISFNYTYDQLRSHYKYFNSDTCYKKDLKRIEKVRKALYTVLDETYDGFIEPFEVLDAKFKAIYGE